MPENIRPMPNQNPVKDWTEDFSHENGNYANICIFCGESFYGHKRRVVCKECNDNTIKDLLLTS